MMKSFKTQVDRYFKELEKPLDRLRNTDRVTFAWSPSSTHLDKACMVITFRIVQRSKKIVIEDIKAKCMDRMDLLDVFMKSMNAFSARRGLEIVVKSPAS